jgi:hypothetical protein
MREPAYPIIFPLALMLVALSFSAFAARRIAANIAKLPGLLGKP